MRFVALGFMSAFVLMIARESATGADKRDRRYFRSEGETKTYLQEKRVELLNQGTASLAITDAQRVGLLKAEELLAPYGKTVLDAAEFYVERHELVKNSRPVDDAITDFLPQSRRSFLALPGGL